MSIYSTLHILRKKITYVTSGIPLKAYSLMPSERPAPQLSQMGQMYSSTTWGGKFSPKNTADEPT